MAVSPHPAAPAGEGPCSRTAAATYGWGNPSRTADFDNLADLGNWWLYDSVGHDGNGRRVPAAITVVDGKVVITVTFKIGTDLDAAQVLVQNRVALAEPALPAAVRRR